MRTDIFLAALIALFIGTAIYFVYLSLTSPLRDIGGPFWARWTKLWYFYRVYLGRFEHDNIALHKKHGTIVRIGPNMYSINSPDVVPTVYGFASKFPKSDWYFGWRHPDPDRWTLFPDQDIKRHAETRKRFQSMYSMSSLVSYEGYVDECAEIFKKRLDELSSAADVINMGHWFQCYAFDVIGDITYSARFGFLDKGEDQGGLLKALDGLGTYSTLMGIYPRLYKLLFNVSARIERTGAHGRQYIMKFVTARMNERVENRKNKEGSIEKAGQPQDFLDKLLQAHDENPEKVTSYHVWMMGLSNLVAGSDTTAISLSATLYYLIRYPNCMRKLRQEINEYEKAGRCGTDVVTFKQSQDMPYLQAVMKEALRLHAATGLPLWRKVPAGGATICGRYFPAGTDVGLNTWVAHYNEQVFGGDAKEFRPERWLKGGGEDATSMKAMEAFYMPFGLGSRTCLGRHISFLEMSKIIPQIVRRYDFELEHPERIWTTINHWFVKPTDFEVRIRQRQAVTI